MDPRVVAERGQHDDARLGRLGHDPARRGDPVDVRHREVHEHDVGRSSTGSARCASRRRRPCRRPRCPPCVRAGARGPRARPRGRRRAGLGWGGRVPRQGPTTQVSLRTRRRVSDFATVLPAKGAPHQAQRRIGRIGKRRAIASNRTRLEAKRGPGAERAAQSDESTHSSHPLVASAPPSEIGADPPRPEAALAPRAGGAGAGRRAPRERGACACRALPTGPRRSSSSSARRPPPPRSAPCGASAGPSAAPCRSPAASPPACRPPLFRPCASPLPSRASGATPAWRCAAAATASRATPTATTRCRPRRRGSARSASTGCRTSTRATASRWRRSTPASRRPPNLGARLLARVDLTSEHDGIDHFGHGSHMAGVIAGGGAHELEAFEGSAPETNLVSIKVAGWDGATDVSTVIAGLQWAVSHRAQYNIRVAQPLVGHRRERRLRRRPARPRGRAGLEGRHRRRRRGRQRGPGRRHDLQARRRPAGDHGRRGRHAGTAGHADDSDRAVLEPRADRATALGQARLLAPGVSLVSDRAPGSHDRHVPPGRAARATIFKGSGTSQAAAIVSGVAARMLEADPTLTHDQVKGVLTATADRRLAGPGGGAGTDRRAAATTAVTPPKKGPMPALPVANAGLTRSTGAGPLEASRGTLHVVRRPRRRRHGRRRHRRGRRARPPVERERVRRGRVDAGDLGRLAVGAAGDEVAGAAPRPPPPRPRAAWRRCSRGSRATGARRPAADAGLDAKFWSAKFWRRQVLDGRVAVAAAAGAALPTPARVFVARRRRPRGAAIRGAGGSARSPTRPSDARRRVRDHGRERRRATASRSRSRTDGEDEQFSLTDAVWVAAIVLAPPRRADARRRRGRALLADRAPRLADKLVFNVGQVALALTAAELDLGARRPDAGCPTRPTAWVLGATAAGAAFLVNASTVAFIIALVGGQPFRDDPARQPARQLAAVARQRRRSACSRRWRGTSTPRASCSSRCRSGSCTSPTASGSRGSSSASRWRTWPAPPSASPATATPRRACRWTAARAASRSSPRASTGCSSSSTARPAASAIS